MDVEPKDVDGNDDDGDDDDDDETLMATDIQPTEWGWKLSNGRYVPILTAIEPAPNEILNVVQV